MDQQPENHLEVVGPTLDPLNSNLQFSKILDKSEEC